MRSVLISIRPKWCELIANRMKTIEVRKTRPKIDTPFKCYIYCTKPKYKARKNDPYPFFWGPYSGKVIGEFVCDEIIDVWPGYAGNFGDDCLTFDEREAYLGERGHGYGWHISDLVIYDQPKALMEFRKPLCERVSDCHTCQYWSFHDRDCHRNKYLSRPPQSWCYVEEVV